MNPQQQPLDDPAARSLLQLAIAGSDDPLAAVLNDVAAHGESAVRSALERTLGCGPETESGILQGGASVDQLLAWKTRAKLAWQASTVQDDRGAALLTYLLCIASALAHHGVGLSSRPRSEVENLLVSASSTLPPRWERLITRALQHD